MDDTEAEYLLNKEIVTNFRKSTTRRIIVEPMLTMYFMTMLAWNSIIQQWLHTQIAKSYNFTDPNSDSGNSSCSLVDVNSSAISNKIQSETSAYFSLISVASLIPSLTTIILLGSYSDHTGRKKAIISPLLGFFIQTVLSIIIITLDLSMFWICLAAFLGGIGGHMGCILMVGYAYLADMTSTDERMFRFVLLEVFCTTGSTASSVATGFLIKSLGFAYPMIISAGLILINLTYSMFWIPELVVCQTKVKFFTCDNISKSFRLCTKDNGTNRRWKINVILVLSFLYLMMELGGLDIQTFYFLNPPLCWTSVLIGIYSGYNLLTRSCGSIIAVKVFGARLREEPLIIAAFVCSAGYYLVLASAPVYHNIVFFAPLVGFCSFGAAPLIRTIASKLVDVQEQGALLALFSWSALLSGMCGNVGMNALYIATLSFGSGAVYLILAFLFVIPVMLIISYWVARSWNTKGSDTYTVISDVEVVST